MKRVIIANSLDDYMIKSKNPNTSAEVLKELADHADYFVRWNVAENPNTSSDVLRKLADDADEPVRECVAENSNTPLDVLRKLADDADYDVRCGVARNLNTPADVLRKLADDADNSVRRNVARNLNTPTEVLRTLADDVDYFVRKNVVENPNTPSDVKKLLNNKDKQQHAKVNWSAKVEEYADDSNELYEKLLDEPESEVNVKLQIFCAPSTQGGQGMMFIYDASGQDRFDTISMDFAEWCEAEYQMAKSVKSSASYAKKYEKFVRDILNI